MGVHGLWRLIEPSGKPVPLETLENKILAVDISIWLHQAIKGFQDSRGAPLPNAHLLGVYHRICKLLYFRIKPVFVFDGGVPILKKQTIEKRIQQKNKMQNDANDIQTKLIRTLLKHSAVSKVLNEKTHKTDTDKDDDMFKLPEKPHTDLESIQDDSDSSSSDSCSPVKQWDLHTIDMKSEHFRSLPADVRYEILTDLKETRKQSSWGRIHELPTESGDFSHFQMKRLLKRFSVQTSLEEAEKEMGGHSLSLGQLEELLNADGVITNSDLSIGNRIASNETTRYVLIKDVQKAMEKAKKDEEKSKKDNEIEEITTEELSVSSDKKSVNNDEYDRDLAAAIQLSLQDQPSTSSHVETRKDSSFLDNFNDGDFQSDSESDNETTLTRLTQAKNYMMEYSGLTLKAIDNILNANNKSKIKHPKKENLINIKHNLKKCDKTELECNKIKINDTKLHNVQNTEIKLIEDENINNDTQETKNKNTLDLIDSNNINKESENVKESLPDNSESEHIDSDDSDDFIEVSNESVETKPLLEIVINPNHDSLQNDIFSDIFSSNLENINKSNKNISEKEKSEINKNDRKISAIAKENFQITIKDNHVTKQNTEMKQKELIKKAENVSEHDKNEVIKILESDKSEQDLIMEEPEKNIVSEHDKDEVITSEDDKSNKPQLTVEELNAMKTNLAVEQQDLITERNTKQRMAGNITDQMYQEAQELLELFGVPYIIAPKEAEAQCAFLNEIDLTDGTITDDSDIWLFGGKTVYKNFFNSNKHVLEFRADSIEHHFKLSREQLILLALLVGSDYTIGLQGIGPVTALEILAAFPASRQTNATILNQNELITGLADFKNWLLGEKLIGPGRTTLRNKLKNVKISEGFPSIRVVQAYLQPDVETARDTFTWSKPDIVGLIDYAREKFGWTRLKSEEILKPVIRKLEEKHVQKSIRDYYATKHKIDGDSMENKMSKRVKTAINKIGQPTTSENDQIEPIERKKVSRKSKNSASQAAASKNKSTTENNRKPRAKKPVNLHAKEVIPQKERDKIDAFRSKIKAIEVFRKSKQGPGYVQKRSKIVREPKEEAELSESSSSD